MLPGTRALGPRCVSAQVPSVPMSVSRRQSHCCRCVQLLCSAAGCRCEGAAQQQQGLVCAHSCQLSAPLSHAQAGYRPGTGTLRPERQGCSSRELRFCAL